MGSTALYNHGHSDSFAYTETGCAELSAFAKVRTPVYLGYYNTRWSEYIAIGYQLGAENCRAIA